MKPEITIHDAITGITEVREMTDQEYADHLAALPPNIAPEEANLE